MNEGKPPASSAPGTKVYELIDLLKPYLFDLPLGNVGAPPSDHFDPMTALPFITHSRTFDLIWPIWIRYNKIAMQQRNSSRYSKVGR